MSLLLTVTATSPVAVTAREWGPGAGAILPTSSFCPSPRAGIPEDSKVEGPAFTDAIRMYRQSKELYGTWEMLCGNEVQVRLGRLRKSARGPEGGLSTPAGPRALAAVWTQITRVNITKDIHLGSGPLLSEPLGAKVMATAGWLRNQRGETRRNNERIYLKPELCQACLFILTELTCSPSRPCLCLSLLCYSLASLQLHLRHPPKQITKTPKCLENGQGKNFY